MKIFLSGLLAVVVLLMTSPLLAREVRISAAASLTDALKELVAVYRREHRDATILPNFASSGALAKQLVAGAPADIYISANPKWLEYLQQQGLIALGSEQILVHNRLVFVGLPGNQARLLEDLPALQRIALASPKAAPAGKYAEQALMAAGLYPQLQAGGKLILAKDVRQALIYAERGEVDGAFVYRTDALLAKQGEILFSVPQNLYPQVSYPAALTLAGLNNPPAQSFFHFLFSAQAQQILASYGFLIP